jgi:adenosylcobinamide-GDP ribazoletransferase
MNGVVRSAAAATTFLTRVPLGLVVRTEAADVARGVWLFPLVGAAVGGASGLAADVTAEKLPELAAGAIAIGVAALLTGAMHLDGLADAADALGGRTRERALEIMRDPAIGAFGVTAVVSVLLLDATLFGALAASGDAALAAVAAGAAGRAALLLPALALPYARSQHGQGSVVEGIGAPLVLAAFVVAMLLVLPERGAGLAGLGAAVGVALVLTAFFRHQFGGVTGDLLGATAKLAETSALALVVVLAH